MSRRKYTYNAFETTLASGISAGTTDIELTSVVNLRADGYLVIEDDSASKREYISFGNINGSTLEQCDRGLAGSAAGGQAHDAGKTVRGVMMHQFIDDIFDDIEEIDAAVTTVVSDVTTAEADIASLQTNEFSETDHASVDHGPIVAATFASGTRMVFDQDSAPTGWTRDTTTINDKMIRIVTGTRADGGSWDQSNHTHGLGSHTHDLASHIHAMADHSHVISDHTHTAAAHTHGIAAHSHSGGTTSDTGTTAIAHDDLDGGPQFEYVIKQHTHTQASTTGQSGGSITLSDGDDATTLDGPGATQSSGSGSNTDVPSSNTSGASGGTSAGGKTATSWRPAHRDMIVAVKD